MGNNMTTIGLHAPFLMSWMGVWLFAFLGGLASGFVKISDIDNRLLYPFISKPLIGMTAGVAIAVFINQNAEPPPTTLIFWALIGALFSTPIITGFAVFISDQKRQNELYKSAQDKFVPWSKKERRDDDV